MPDHYRKDISTFPDRVLVRQAVSDDAADLRNLRLEALAAHPTAFSADLALATAETPQDWVDRISGSRAHPPMAIFVAQHGDNLVGMAGIIRGNRPKTAHTASIWGVYVAEAHRHHGVGRALIEACLSWAREVGVLVVRIAATTTNTPAIKCYANAGFAPYGTEPKSLFWQGVYYDELLLSYEL